MNGAEAILRMLQARGIDHVFANPGTSEMQFVAALDRVPGVRPVLGLFEGVCTGAADGFARMAGRPAATLLHLGPGLANGLANLHNARRAGSPIFNLVGNHARDHLAFDAPLASDIDSLARPMSHRVLTLDRSETLCATLGSAIEDCLSSGGQIVTAIVPADIGWSNACFDAPVNAGIHPTRTPHDAASLAGAVKALQTRPDRVMLFAGGDALTPEAMDALDSIRRATGCRVATPTFNARLPRGRSRPVFERTPYLAEQAEPFFAEVETLVLLGARAPVNFFAYPGRSSMPLPAGCRVVELAAVGATAACAATDLCERLDLIATRAPARAESQGAQPDGSITPQSLADSLARHLPEGAIVVDESVTSGIHLLTATENCPDHDWLDLTGGSIGQGLPVATGAAIASPGRKVVTIEGDGSALYTIQSLWTQAREQLDVTTVICNNAAYRVLNLEMLRTSAEPSGPRSASTLSLADPSLDFVAIADGLGVPALRVQNASDLDEALRDRLSRSGPFVIDAVFA